MPDHDAFLRRGGMRYQLLKRDLWGREHPWDEVKGQLRYAIWSTYRLRMERS